MTPPMLEPQELTEVLARARSSSSACAPYQLVLCKLFSSLEPITVHVFVPAAALECGMPPIADFLQRVELRLYVDNQRSLTI